eukprot:CAMPEP_0114135860 /NCGR_PEP_ID=MMETSP0043_2-20121206/14910_1 /TAXON_ID=464988 /ORGANISM="Hemiselmis andersenii, Strain CCMP644" /LENGTH=66 /DNA_ID=CAMNT_0001229583 /DNA_START=113 /DNA_END=313 /DNA_ORIENTATION=+
MDPDFENTSCSMYFGATPPEMQSDAASKVGCLETCPIKKDVGQEELDGVVGVDEKGEERCKKLLSA